MQFKPRSFWTPRYIVNRLALAYDQRRNPTAPWWPRDARRHLDDMLRRTDVCFEWGSGRSTVWLSARTGVVHSIEHDPEWHTTVSEDLRRQGLAPERVRLLSTDPAHEPDTSPYVRAIDDFGDASLDVCVVDGEYRDHCALAAVPKVRPGGLIIVDDATWFLDRPTHAPHSRNGAGPATTRWAEFARLVADWRAVW